MRNTREQAIDGYNNHICPSGNRIDERVRVMSAGRTTYQKMWDYADKCYVHWQESKQRGDTPAIQSRFAGQMEGMAEAIVYFMTPAWPDISSVAKECKARFIAKRDGHEHFTAGVDYEWRPTGKGEQIPRSVPDVQTEAQAKATAAPKLVDQDVRGKIIAALNSPMGLDDGTLASMFKVTSGEVAAIRADIGK